MTTESTRFAKANTEAQGGRGWAWERRRGGARLDREMGLSWIWASVSRRGGMTRAGSMLGCWERAVGRVRGAGHWASVRENTKDARTDGPRGRRTGATAQDPTILRVGGLG